MSNFIALERHHVSARARQRLARNAGPDCARSRNFFPAALVGAPAICYYREIVIRDSPLERAAPAQKLKPVLWTGDVFQLDTGVERLQLCRRQVIWKPSVR